MPDLTPEIYLQVFQQICTLPPTHRRFDVAPFQGQTDLLNCIKVCRLWYNLAAPNLYRIPIVHCFRSFLFRTSDPPIEGLQPKSQLIKRVERLFLEYEKRKPEWLELSDEEIRAYSEEIGERNMGVCRKDLAHLDWAERTLRALSMVNNSPSPTYMFPRIRTLSIDAINGAHRRHLMDWPSEQTSRRWNNLRKDLHEALTVFIGSTGILDVCQTAYSNPLSLRGHTSYASAIRTGNVTVASHNSSHNQVFSPGLQSRWYLHVDRQRGLPNSYILDSMYRLVEQALRHHLNRRREHASAQLRKHDKLGDISGAIYIAAAEETTEDHGYDFARETMLRTWAGSTEFRIKTLFETSQGSLPHSVKVSDNFEVRVLSDVPVCRACGWDPVGH